VRRRVPHNLRLGFTEISTGAAAADETAPRCLDAFAAFRDEVRALAKAKADPGDVAAACDRLRDGALADLGVKLEEGPNGARAGWGPGRSGVQGVRPKPLPDLKRGVLLSRHL
jgi:hypothetical protein